WLTWVQTRAKWQVSSMLESHPAGSVRTASQDEPLLSLEAVDLGYGELQVVFGVSLHVGAHELIGLVGGNGSGKSTILRAVSGMIKPRGGRIMFAGEDVGGLTPHQMAL